MARWSASQNNWTPTAVADTTNFTNTGYFAIQGGTATQRSNVLEVYMGGLAGASAPAQMIFARDSTVGATGLSGGNFTPLTVVSANLAANPTQFSTSTTKPQRSATAQLLLLAFNAFGGVVRWVAAPGMEIEMLGNAAPATGAAGEVSLSSASTGTPGLMSCHFIIEPF